MVKTGRDPSFSGVTVQCNGPAVIDGGMTIRMLMCWSFAPER